MTEQQILYRNDIILLYEILAKLTPLHKDIAQGSRDEFIKWVLELERFCAIHSTRTGDLLNCYERLDIARSEFRKLQNQLEDLREINKKLQEVNKNLISEILDSQ